ncbi:hypothetical protein CSUI_001700 [Cystoisospora suis]|uniref:Uncharacterized protein n=1 Tax=Cystoisospora suis TaxID=483139 RepID=A0A2C6LBE8_9APIC|nr:hypothetical protein CSUI_001700 [Cystoisospora suis]
MAKFFVRILRRDSRNLSEVSENCHTSPVSSKRPLAIHSISTGYSKNGEQVKDRMVAQERRWEGLYGPCLLGRKSVFFLSMSDCRHREKEREKKKKEMHRSSREGERRREMALEENEKIQKRKRMNECMASSVDVLFPDRFLYRKES